jgi:hypothetical protein
MRDVVDARAMIAEAGAAIGLSGDGIDRIFEGAPSDFRVIISTRLPFFVHLAGMVGITLFGRVYIRSHMRSLPPAALLLLLRHEAEHVAQQRREGALFYPRYLFGWLLGLARELLRDAKHRAKRGAQGGAWYRAYRNLPAEREAYDAEKRARIVLNTLANR